MNEESRRMPPGEDVPEQAEKQLTVNAAAQALGVDTVTMCRLIQQGDVMPARAPSGEITVPGSELARLMGKRG